MRMGYLYLLEKLLSSPQHDDMLDKYETEANELAFVKRESSNNIVKPVLDSYGYPYSDEH